MKAIDLAGNLASVRGLLQIMSFLPPPTRPSLILLSGRRSLALSPSFLKHHPSPSPTSYFPGSENGSGAATLVGPENKMLFREIAPSNESSGKRTNGPGEAGRWWYTLGA